MELGGFIVKTVPKKKRLGVAELKADGWHYSSPQVGEMVERQKAEGFTDQEVLDWFQDWTNGYIATTPL
jgi:hypothetical protein